MSDAAWALQTARQVGPIHPPHAHPHPIHKLHTGPLHSHVAGRTDHLPSNVPNHSYVLPAETVTHWGEDNTLAGFKVIKRMFEGAHREFGGSPYAGDNGPYGQGEGLPYAVGHAKGGQITIGRNEKQTTVGPGYEEWQTQPSGGVPDPQNSVTGPMMPQGPSFQDQLEDNRNRQDIIDQHVGTPLAGGGQSNSVPVALAGGEHALSPAEVLYAGMGDMEAGHKALDGFVLRTRKLHIKTIKKLAPPKRD